MQVLARYLRSTLILDYHHAEISVPLHNVPMCIDARNATCLHPNSIDEKHMVSLAGLMDSCFSYPLLHQQHHKYMLQAGVDT